MHLETLDGKGNTAARRGHDTCIDSGERGGERHTMYFPRPNSPCIPSRVDKHDLVAKSL